MKITITIAIERNQKLSYTVPLFLKRYKQMMCCVPVFNVIFSSKNLETMIEDAANVVQMIISGFYKRGEDKFEEYLKENHPSFSVIEKEGIVVYEISAEKSLCDTKLGNYSNSDIETINLSQHDILLS